MQQAMKKKEVEMQQMKKKEVEMQQTLDLTLTLTLKELEDEHAQKMQELQAKEAEMQQQKKQEEAARRRAEEERNLLEARGLFLQPVPIGSTTFNALAQFLHVDRPDQLGQKYNRDHADMFPDLYNSFALARAWKVDNPTLLGKYEAARKMIANSAGRPCTKFPIRKAFIDASKRLPELMQNCNEVRLVHGTGPQHLLKIFSSGFNERYSGSSAGSMFGKGI